MKKIRTHYDNLKVARNAPQEVIRAAYKTLAQKYHPDKNVNSSEALEIMTILNKSFEILSNPEKRREHDLWIISQEDSDECESPKNRMIYSEDDTNKSSYWVWYFFAFLVIISLISEYSSRNDESLIDIDKSNSLIAAYSRPSLAPNGSSWPKEASYIDNYPILYLNGNTNIYFSNDSNYDLYLKLIDENGNDSTVIRHVYIPRYNNFNISNLKDGSYEINISNINNGENYTLNNIITAVHDSQIEISIYQDFSNKVNFSIVDESIHE